MKTKILIIDDESSIRNFLRVTLESSGFNVFEADSGEAGLEHNRTNPANLIILDYGLPGLNGIEILKRLRLVTNVPIIFLTVRDSDDDKVLALDSGADDYLTKPFSVTELMARIRVAIRHSSNEKGEVLQFGKLQIDLGVHKIFYDKVDLKLTGTEYELLKILIEGGERLVPHKMILQTVWGPNSTDYYHYLRVYFGQMRKKLEKVSPGAGAIIETESGVGYRLKYLK